MGAGHSAAIYRGRMRLDRARSRTPAMGRVRIAAHRTRGLRHLSHCDYRQHGDVRRLLRDFAVVVLLLRAPLAEERTRPHATAPGRAVAVASVRRASHGRVLRATRPLASRQAPRGAKKTWGGLAFP